MSPLTSRVWLPVVIPLSEIPVYCPEEFCTWKGKYKDCVITKEQESWEMPPHDVAHCPECGEPVES